MTPHDDRFHAPTFGALHEAYSLLNQLGVGPDRLIYTAAFVLGGLIRSIEAEKGKSFNDTFKQGLTDGAASNRAAREKNEGEGQ